LSSAYKDDGLVIEKI